MVRGAREVMAMAFYRKGGRGIWHVAWALSEKQPCSWVALLRDVVRGARALGALGRAGARTGGAALSMQSSF